MQELFNKNDFQNPHQSEHYKVIWFFFSRNISFIERCYIIGPSLRLNEKKSKHAADICIHRSKSVKAWMKLTTLWPVLEERSPCEWKRRQPSSYTSYRIISTWLSILLTSQYYMPLNTALYCIILSFNSSVHIYFKIENNN